MMSKKRTRSHHNKRVKKFPPSEDLSYPNTCKANLHRNDGSSRHVEEEDNHSTRASLSVRRPIGPAQRQGSVACIEPIVSDQRQKQLDQLAVSVHYLSTQFLKEVKAAGHSREAPIYKIENLEGPPGVIRRKGLAQKCPVDGKVGAAYVHCVTGDDFVGKATHMLSYSWRYVV